MRHHRSEKYIGLVIIFAVMLMITIGVMQVQAADIMLEGKVTSVTQKINKQGAPYTIVVIPSSRELNGVKYTTDLSVFCFKSEDAKKLKAGDQVKMIAKQTSSKDGNEFITLIAFVK